MHKILCVWVCIERERQRETERQREKSILYRIMVKSMHFAVLWPVTKSKCPYFLAV